MDDQNNENLVLNQCGVDQALNDDNIDPIASNESNSNAKQKRKYFASIVSIEGIEFVDVGTNSYRICQNALKRRKIEIVRVNDAHAKINDLLAQIDGLKSELIVERNLVRTLK